MTVQNQQLPQNTEEGTGCLPALPRLLWMFGGPITLIFCLLYMVLGRATLAVDSIYVLSVCSMVVVRYLDIKLYKGEKFNGQPATLNHWRRYSLALLLGAAVLFAAAKAFSRLHLL